MYLDVNNYKHISQYEKIEDFHQYFPDNFKQEFGAIFTSFYFIDHMFSFFDSKIFTNPNLKWCDLGCGIGYFSIFLYFKLMNNLSLIEDKKKRSEHIINNMIFMVDKQANYIPILIKIFGNQANIICKDVLIWKPEILFDVIISNPPFHCNHVKQVPTNKEKKDVFMQSETIWPKFILQGFNLLKSNGQMLMVVPSLWCKYDSYGIYDLIVKYLIKVKLFTNTEINKIFHYQAQTPCSIFLILKEEKEEKEKINKFLVYDSILERYVDFSLYKNKQSIPMKSVSLCSKFYDYTLKYGNIEHYSERTKMPSKKVKLNDTYCNEFCYVNIHSTILEKNKDFSKPKLVIKYSNIPCSFYKKKKIVLAHKMYGFPYYDISGNYGISNRDNYVIYNLKDNDFLLLQSFTSSILFIYLLECFKYRMKMIEPCILQYIPDITKMKLEFKSKTNIKETDDYWFDVFECSLQEKNYIKNYFSKNYYRIPEND